jgi:hypothetical protein
MSTDDKLELTHYEKQPVMVEGRMQEYAPMAVLGEHDAPPPPLRRHRCAIGDYPWDRWQARAIAAGVDSKLAAVGRLLMREADQHSWPIDLQAECGWPDVDGAHGDEGDRLIRRALDDPEGARELWQELLDTDAGRASLW